MTMLGYGAGYSEKPLTARDVLVTLAGLFQDGRLSSRDAPAIVVSLKKGQEKLGISPGVIEQVEQELGLTDRGNDTPTPREQRIFFGVAAVSFVAFACFAVKVHKDRAANANAALQGVDRNPIALVSEHYQNRR